MLYNSHANVALKDFENYKVPKREGETVYWQGVAHQDIVKAVKKVSKSHGFKVIGEQYQLSKDRHNFFASWDFNKEVPGCKGLGMALGYRGSNIGRYAHTWPYGARVSICQNGMVAGEFTYKRKHTTQVDVMEMVEECFTKYLEHTKGIAQMVTNLRKRTLTDDEAAYFMLEACRRGIISWSKLRVVDAQWREPEHDEFSDYNAWSLYNGFTQAAKLTTPAQQIEIMRDIPALLLEEIEG